VKVVDPKLLDTFRGAGACSWCNRWCRYRHAAHVFARGMGGGGRLDVALNLVSLCPECHLEHHDGRRPLRCDLLAVVAAREGMLQGEVEAQLHRLRRQAK
jgi:hypothetical protein